MKIKVSTAELQKAISNIKSCSAKNASTGVQALEFYVNNSEATITASNGVVMAQAQIECDGDNGQFSLDGKNFIAYCEKLGGDEVSLSVGEKMVTVKCGGLTARVSKIADEATDYFESQSESVEIESGQFKRLISIALSCAGTNDIRPVLNGVYLKADSGNITAVGCDSFKIAVYESTIQQSETAVKAIIPSSAIVPIIKSPSVSGNHSIKISSFRGTKIRIACGDDENPVIFVSNLIYGEYVDYERLIPKSGEVRYEVDAHSMSEAISTAQIAGDNTYLKFTFSGDSVTVSSASATTQVDIEKPCKCTGRDTTADPFVIGFNGSYIAKVIGVAGDSFSLAMSNPNRPAVLRSETKYNSDTPESVTLMVLPVRMREQ